MQTDEDLPLVLPAELDLVDGHDEPEPEIEDARMPLNLLRLKHMGPSPQAAPITVELDKTVPASGILQVKGQQIWLGPDRAGTPIILRICTAYLRVFLAGVLIKTVGSKLAASDLHALVHTQQARVVTTDPPAAPPASAVIEVDGRSMPPAASASRTRRSASGSRWPDDESSCASTQA